MKKVIRTICLTSGLSLASAGVLADHHRHYRDNPVEKGRVTHVEPIYRTVTVSQPERECRDEPRHRDYRQQSYTRTIAGGIIGGVIGNQFGDGNGRTVMTIAGTLLGGSVGRDMDTAYQNVDVGTESRCRIVEHHYREQRIDAYEVSYRYRGKTYTTIMDHHPGKFIPVDVYVEPRRSHY
ncbi:MAG: hypothetical protein Kow0083_04990 [Methylophaga sp.]